MDTRKVIQMAGKVFFLTIPASYRKAHDVKKGDVFTVEEDERGRLIYTKLVDPTVDPVNIFGEEEEGEDA